MRYKGDVANGIDSVHLGDHSVVFIINKKDEHAYDGFEFGAKRYQTGANFVDIAGRLPEGERVQTQYGESTFAPPTRRSSTHGSFIGTASMLAVGSVI